MNPSSDDQPHDRDRSSPRPRGVVDGASRVLKALPLTRARGQAAELSRITGLPRPTVYRLLGQLLDAGVVEMRSDGGYGLSLQLTMLSQHAEPLPGLRRLSLEFLSGIREHTGGAASLVVSDGEREVAVEMVPGRDSLPIDARAGEFMPRVSAAGRALWPSSARPERLRDMGAAVDDEDLFPGLTCYAVSLRLPGGRLAALQLATPAASPAERHAPVVLRASQLLAAAVRRELRPRN